MIKEVLFKVLMVFIHASLGSIFIKDAIDQYREGRYYRTGIEIFGAFYIMLLMAKFVLG